MSQNKPPSVKMTDDKLKNKFNKLNIAPKTDNNKTDINILLLGGTGVGKSTLINAFANYLTYSDLKKAKKDKLMVLIPSKFRVQDKNNEYHIVNSGTSDQNEYLETGESATQDVKTYVFPIWDGKITLRLIDTPGMGDTRGIQQDNTNSESILSYISKFHELHAICFLLKPNESRITVFFKYCMNQIFSRLDKSASDNIIFCFTNTRGTDYSPGETLSTLKKLVEDIGTKPPHAKIPLNRNIFCFENEPFRYLAAVEQGVEFDSDVKDRNKESWDKSATQCWKLIHYITGDKDNRPLKPHHVKSTNAINEARRMINQLAQPLAEITQLIHHNMSVLERHRENIRLDKGSLEEMKAKLYIPVITLETIQMTQPATVCTTTKCSKVYHVAGKNVMDYTQRCHDPCYLNNVPKEIIGSAELINCASMAGTTCQRCNCDFRVHMHIYYMTKTKEVKEKDQNMQKKITNREDLMKGREQMMVTMEVKKNELAKEHEVIVETCAKFAHFLQNNAITPFNDAYEEYIKYLINREQSLGNLCNTDTLDHLNSLLQQYCEIKSRFDDALLSNRAIGNGDIVTPKEVSDSIFQILYKLKHNGKKIKELYECQKKSRNKEHQNTEYVHTIPIKKEKKEKDKSERKDKDKSERKDKDKSERKDKEKSERKDKEKSERKDKEKSERKDKDKTGDKHSKDTQRSRNHSPPPTYQEAAYRRGATNYAGGNQYQNQPHNYHYGGLQSPPMYSNYPPAPTPYPPQGGPPYGQPADGRYPPPESPNAYGHNYNFRAPDKDLRDYDINITVKKTGESTSNQAHPQLPAPPQHPYPPHYAPNPNYGPNQSYPQYPPHNYPPYGGPNPPPPPPQGYPPYPPNTYNPQYDFHHGVSRPNYDQQGNSSGRGNNNYGRGNYMGNRGRGGVHKRNHNKKEFKNDKNEEKKKNKNKKKQQSSDSDSSDSSSS